MESVNFRYVADPIDFGVQGWSYVQTRTVVIPLQADSVAAHTALFEIGHQTFFALRGGSPSSHAWCIASHAFADLFVESDGHLGVDLPIDWSKLDLTAYRQAEACAEFVAP